MQLKTARVGLFPPQMPNSSFGKCLQPKTVKSGLHQNLLLWLVTDEDTSRYIV